MCYRPEPSPVSQRPQRRRRPSRRRSTIGVDRPSTIEYTSSMNRRGLFLGLGGLAISAAAGYAALALTAGPQLKEENINKIEVGMTRAEVESLLGGPPGDYGPRADFGSLFGNPPREGALEWHGVNGGIRVLFDAQAIVEF